MRSPLTARNLVQLIVLTALALCGVVAFTYGVTEVWSWLTR